MHDAENMAWVRTFERATRRSFEMRNLIKHGLVFASLLTIASTAAACGGEEKPAQAPSDMNAPPPPAPMPESKPATTDAKPVETPSTETAAPAKPAEKPLTDAEIVAVTSTANNGEIEMAQLASKTATNADVKNFAAMMITQHRDMETKGKALAAKAKITPADNEASTALKSDVQSTLTNLKTQKGKEFDKAYMEAQVKAHRDVLNMFDNKLLPNAQNGELKTLLTDARGHVATHLAKAEEISKKLESAPAAATPAAKPGATPAKPATPATPPAKK
jgi:putative membrane protein